MFWPKWPNFGGFMKKYIVIAALLSGFNSRSIQAMRPMHQTDIRVRTSDNALNTIPHNHIQYFDLLGNLFDQFPEDDGFVNRFEAMTIDANPDADEAEEEIRLPISSNILQHLLTDLELMLQNLNSYPEGQAIINVRQQRLIGLPLQAILRRYRAADYLMSDLLLKLYQQ